MSGRLDVMSCGVGPLPERACVLVRQAEVLFASAALLAACPDTGADRRVIDARARERAQEAVALFQAGRRVVVLTSGDALFHGFGGTLSALLAQSPTGMPPGDRMPSVSAFGGDACASAFGGDATGVHFYPDVTAFQVLFHRLGLAWDEAVLFSVHAGGALPLRGIVEAPLAVVYGGSAHPAHELAARLLAFHPQGASRSAVLAENLGTAGERILRGTLGSLAAASVGATSFLVLLAPDADDEGPVLPLGLPVQDYERDNNLITSAGARPLILALLRLPARGVLWDMGAGSGAVGLEAAALRPGLRVLAVEKHAERAAMICRNRDRLGVCNHEVRCGDALDVCADGSLPRPQRVFLGGGGKDLPELLGNCYAALAGGGVMVAVAVTLESTQRLYGWRPECRVSSCSLDVAQESPLAGGSRHLRSEHRLTLFVFGKAGR